jgi:kinesin family protein 4/21/27
MIACLSPVDRFLEENVSTLNYAARASLISNAPMKNIDQNVVQVQQQKNKIQDLEKELK